MINKQVGFVAMRFLSLNRIYAVKFRYVVPDSTVCQGGHQEMVLGGHTHTQHMCITMGTSQSLEAKGKLVPHRKSYCVSFFFLYIVQQKTSTCCLGSSAISASPGCCEAGDKGRTENSEKQHLHLPSFLVARDGCTHPVLLYF